MIRCLIVLLAAALVVGCNNDKDTTPPAKSPTAPAKVAEPAKVAVPLVYTEGTVKGRTVVVGTPKAIEALAKGSAPTVCVTKIGYGPKGETVVFEAADKDPSIEKMLMAEFDKRHPKK